MNELFKVRIFAPIINLLSYNGIKGLMRRGAFMMFLSFGLFSKVKGDIIKNTCPDKKAALGLLPGAISGNQTFCLSGNPVTFNDSVSATTSCSNLLYQWQSSPDGSAWTDIPGAVSSIYDAPSLTITTFYRRATTDDCNNIDYSNIVTVIIYNPSAPSATNVIRCGSGSLTLTASGSTSSYNWYSTGTGGSLLGTGPAFTTPSIDSTTTYFVTSVDVNGCENSTRVPVKARIKFNPSVQFNSPVQAGCPSAILKAIAGGGDRSLFLDGVNDYVQLPDLGISSDFSVGAWVYLRSYGSNARLLDLGNGSGSDNIILTLSGAGGLPSMTIYNGTTSIVRTSNFLKIPLNQWAHIAYVLSGNTASIYINGQFAGGGTMNVPVNIPRTNNYLGRSNTPTDAYTSANIDELSIWSTAFTSAQVSANIYTSVTGTMTGLLAVWKMNEGTGSSISDAKSGLTGILLNGAGWSSTCAPLALTYSWSPSATLSASTGMVVTASPLSSTIYTVTVQDSNGCSASADITVNPGTPGDTSIYGNGQWNVYGFESINYTNYNGFFTSSPLNIDSRNDFQRFSSPSYAVGFQGCTINVDNHSVSYKRTNIPAQTYRIDVNVNDDGCILNIDGKQKFTRTANATTAAAWIGNLTTSSKVEFKWFDNTLVSQGGLTFTPITAPTLSGGVISGDQTFCFSGDPTAISSSGPAIGCYIAGYQWQSSLDNSGWSDISGATSLTYDPGVLTDTTFFRRKAYDECGATAYSNTVTILVVTPNAASGINGSHCGSGAVTLSATGSPNVYHWYDVASGGTSLASTTSFITPSISITTTYYVTHMSVEGCESTTRTPVVAVINPVPAPATGVDGARCGAGTVVLSVSGSAVNYDWYDISSGGSVLMTSSNFTTPSISATTTFYVTSVNIEGCESTSRTPVTATINPVYSQPSGSGAANCGPGTVSLSASGSPSTYRWYDVPTGGTSMGTASSFSTPVISATTSYYVSSVGVEGCESVSRTTVIATINSVPSAPVGTDGAMCGPGSVTLFANGSPATYQWYDVSSGGTSLSSSSNFSTPVINTSTTYYVTSVSGPGCESTTRTPVSAIINIVPSAPTGVDGARCGTGSVLISATGSPSSYNWYDVPSGGISLANTSTFTTPSKSTTTTYYASSVGTSGCESSRMPVVAMINPIPPVPSKTDGSNCGAGTVTLLASGSPATYNWYSSSVGGTTLATTPSFITPAISTTTTYYVTSVSAAGCENGTRVAVIATIRTISIGGNLSPTDTVCTGTNGSSIFLSGQTGNVIGWESSLDNFTSAGTAIANTNPTLAYVNLTQTTYFRATVQSAGCPSANSSVVTITVIPLPPSPSGTNGFKCGPGTVILSASGPAWTYNWYDVSTGGIPLDTGSIFATPVISTTTTYYITSVNAAGCESSARTSVIASISSTSSGGTLSSGATVCSGSNGATITLSGHTGNITGWESSLDNFASAGTPIANTTVNLNYSNLTQTTSYKAIVQVPGCTSANSSIVTISVTPVSAGGTLGPGATVCSGSNGATITLTGYTGNITGWESSLNNFASAGTAIANTTANLNYTNLTQTTSYRAMVQAPGCSSVYSSIATITIVPASAGGNTSPAATICSGSNGGSITLSGETGTIIGWESSLDNFVSAGSSIVNTSNNLSYTNLTQTTYYRAIVQAGSCPSSVSSIVTISVIPASAGGTLNSDATVCSGSNGATITLTGHYGNVTSWESSLNNFASAGTVIANTTVDLNYTNLTQTTSYRAMVQAAGCSSVYSSIVTINVVPASAGGNISPAATVCSGSNGGTITLSGETGTIIGWESSLDNFVSAGSSIANTSNNLNYTNLAQTTYYRAIVQAAGCPSSISSTVIISVIPASTGGTLNSDAMVCSGSNGANIVLSGNTGAVIGWESSSNAFATAGTSIANNTSALTYTNLTQTTSYRAIVQSASCPSDYSSIVTITVTPATVGGTVGPPATVCYGSNGAINLTGHYGNITGWEYSLDTFATAGTPVSNLSATLSYTNLTQTTSYRANVQAAGCPSLNSSIATIEVTPLSVGGTLNSVSTVCSGPNIVMITLSGHTGNVIGWESSLDNFISDQKSIINANPNLTYTDLTKTTSYRAIVQSPGCPSVLSSVATVTVIPSSIGGALSSPATVCAGSNGATINLNGYSGTITGWEYSLDTFATSGIMIANSNPDFTYSNLTQTTSYRAIVQSSGCPAANSSIVTIEVTPLSSGGTLNSSAIVCTGANGATINLNNYVGNVIGWESSFDNFTTGGTAISITDPYINYTNLSLTTFYRTIVKNGSCPPAYSSVATITVSNDASVNTGILTGADTVLKGNNAGILSLSGNSNPIINWQSSTDNFVTLSSISFNTSTLPYTDLIKTTYYRAVIQGTACPYYFSNVVVITILTEDTTLVIYPSLSPNGDNLNDEWVIDNISHYPNNNIIIYDRWGSVIYKEKGYNNTDKIWKGDVNAGVNIGNKELPDGTYFYMIDLGNGSASKSGYVVIKR